MTKKQRYPQVPKDAGRVLKLKAPLTPKNLAQEMYLDSLRESPVTISNGPAGSGKTFLVTGVALEKLLNNQVGKIVFTRPVVEADESLGFLPGTLEQKLDPYLRPLFDAVESHVGAAMAKKLMESGKIEIAPLAYMRGRTFDNCFVVLDEAQNTKAKQMKMFLTRQGEGSYFCINGDATQCDLEVPRSPTDRANWEHGLDYAVRKLAGKSKNIQFVQFYQQDVVRSSICKEVLSLLESPDPRREQIVNIANDYGVNMSTSALLSPARNSIVPG